VLCLSICHYWHIQAEERITIVSFDTSLSSWTGKVKIAVPLIAGGIIGEYIDQKGYDDKFLSSGFIPKIGAPFDKILPIAAMFIVLAVFFKTTDMGKGKLTVGALGAGAMLGILTNYTAKMVLGAKTSGGSI